MGSLPLLKEIIINPIETPRGYKNADHGIALRGPLSQFFSGIYLKPLDEAFDGMDVTYLRYQDDILILCYTKRQLERCKQRMNEFLLPEPNRIVPHPRTLRKAREQVNQMVVTGLSARRISSYLHRWSSWWVGTSEHWTYQELLWWFFNSCWESNPAADFAAGLLHKAKPPCPEQLGFLPDFESGYTIAL